MMGGGSPTHHWSLLPYTSCWLQESLGLEQVADSSVSAIPWNTKANWIRANSSQENVVSMLPMIASSLLTCLDLKALQGYMTGRVCDRGLLWWFNEKRRPPPSMWGTPSQVLEPRLPPPLPPSLPSFFCPFLRLLLSGVWPLQWEK